jgi:Protein of unknown function (DUF1207)
MSSTRDVSAMILLVLLRAGAAVAQEPLFPSVRNFELPEASPRVHGLVGRVLSAHQGESRFGRGQEAEVALGENFPLVTFKQGPRAIVLGMGAQVYARFSLSDSKSALISNDWVVGLNTTVDLGAWGLTLELHHESSHLGDEYASRFQETRLDWTREVLAGWASYTSGEWRFTGGASYVLADELRLPRPGAALGIDFRGRPRQVFGRSVQPVFGLFTDGTSATDWRLSTSAKLGVALPIDGGDRDVGVALIAHDGLSTQRQFFRQESRYIGFELRFDL